MKIVLVSHVAELGGAERVLLCNASHLASTSNHDISVVFPSRGGQIVRDFEALGVRVCYADYGMQLPIRGEVPADAYDTRSALYEASLFELFRRLCPDVVLVNTGVIPAAVFAASSLGIPVVLHLHGVLSTALVPTLDVLRLARNDARSIRLASKVLVPSSWVKEYYCALVEGLDSEKISLLPNGVRIPPNHSSPSDEKPPSRFVMLCTLEQNKGVDVFLEAAREVLDRHGTGAEFRIYGSGHAGYIESLRQRICQLGLEEVVSLEGRCQNVEEVYRDATAVVVASYVESFSMVAAEAMSHARPVLASACGGPEDLVVSGETGFLFAPGSASELAEHMMFILKHPEETVKMGRKGRERCCENFDLSRLGVIYEKHLLEASGRT